MDKKLPVIVKVRENNFVVFYTKRQKNIIGENSI